jgi:hypothetical protein
MPRIASGCSCIWIIQQRRCAKCAAWCAAVAAWWRSSRTGPAGTGLDLARAADALAQAGRLDRGRSQRVLDELAGDAFCGYALVFAVCGRVR